MEKGGKTFYEFVRQLSLENIEVQQFEWPKFNLNYPNKTVSHFEGSLSYSCV